MNYISKTHEKFYRRLNNRKVLSNPEEFLGPNYEAVLNFWLILDDLSEEQWRVVKECYVAFWDNPSEWVKATDLAWEDSREVVGFNYAYHAGDAAGDVTNSAAARHATRELIAMHKILENHQQSLTFFPMFLEML